MTPELLINRPKLHGMTDSKLSTPRVESELLPSSDLLADPLRMLKLTGVLYCHAELTAPWGLELPRIPDCIAVHIVTAGACYLEVAGQPLTLVSAGSLVMVPHGSAHRLLSEPGATATPLTQVPVQLVTDRYERMGFGGGGAMTCVSYCGVRFDPVGAKRLMQVLPLVIKVDRSDSEERWPQQLVQLILKEAENPQPGSDAIITRLTDVIVVQAIRDWLTESNTQHGWLAALKDRQIGKALALIHAEPAYDWTVVILAKAIGMSRSGFSARFSELMGQSVIQYITEWRMQLAREDMLESGLTIGLVAEKYGYQSEAAFSRAFKRVMGIPPGQVRRRSS